MKGKGKKMPIESCFIVKSTDGRLIVSRIETGAGPAIVVEIHNTLKEEGSFKVSFIEIDLNEAGAFGEALMRLATA